MILTLQNFCLSSIVESIDRYNHLYSTTDNKVLQRGFKILQKVYSKELLKQIIDKELLKEEHAVLLYNKYLKSIDTRAFKRFSWESIVEIFSRIGPDLEEVTIPNCSSKTNQPWKDVICYLQNIKSISYEMRCNDSILECIAKYCPVLEKLSVKHSRDVTNDGLANFCPRKIDKKKGIVGYIARKVASVKQSTVTEEIPCPLLKKIFVDYTSVQDDGIKQLLKSLPSLEELSYSGLPLVLFRMHKNDFCSLCKIQPYSLTHLSLISVADEHADIYDNVLKVSLSMCPNLKCVSCRILKSEHLNLCFMLEDLEELTFDCNAGARIDVSDFLKQRGQKLTSLNLQECTVSFSVFGQCCVHLNKITMNQVDIQCDEKDATPVFHDLRYLSIRHVSLSDSNCKGICGILRASRVLSFMIIDSWKSFPSEVTMEILKCSEKCPLATMVLIVPSVEVEILKAIMKTCSTLEDLVLVCCAADIPLNMEEDLCSFATTVPHNPDITVVLH